MAAAKFAAEAKKKIYAALLFRSTILYYIFVPVLKTCLYSAVVLPVLLQGDWALSRIKLSRFASCVRCWGPRF